MSTSVLYDVPGPIARRRSRIASLISIVLIGAGLTWLVLTLAAPRTIANGTVLPGLFDASRLDILGRADLWLGLWNALLSTLQLAAVGAIFAMVVGMGFLFARTASSRWVRTPAAIVLEFFRGMPVLLMMLFILLVFSTGSFWAGVGALAVYNGALIGEALRAGILALPRGQREAGLAIGLTPLMALLLIEFPQAFRYMLPVIIAQLVVLLKDTSLAFVVGYGELLRYAQNMQNFFGGRYLFTLFAVVLLVYLGVNMLLSWLARIVARRTGNEAVSAE